MSGLSHLDELEAEAIYIIREVAAECEKPVMLYSIGKDSSVMLHLAMKAFYPEKPPFPFLHIDTTWKFREMIEFRDRIDGVVWHLDVGSSHPGAVAGPKGWAVRPLKRYASWVQNVVRQFGPYPARAEDI